MAQYKVIQDIEAEDKLLGPLSLRQFIYAGGAVLMGYLSFLAVSKGLPFLLAIFVPPMLFCMFFAWPWSPDQPTEVWALARIRFLFKPRRRIWDQSGVKDLVTITAPKKIERAYTNGLSQMEVRSRLTALADTIDSRGWAVKNANINMPTLPSYDPDASDRLIDNSSLPQVVSDVDIQADDDMLDEKNNRVAQQFDQMMQTSSQEHRQRIIDQLNGKAAAQNPAANGGNGQAQPDYWFLHESSMNNAKPSDGNVVFANPQVVHPGTPQAPGPPAGVPTPSEEAVAQNAIVQGTNNHQVQNMHLRTINPIDPQAQAQPQPQPQMSPDPSYAQQSQPSYPMTTSPLPPADPQQADTSVPQQSQTPPMTPQTDAAILSLANRDDLDVATIARQAQRAKNPDDSDDEVVISLR